MKDIPLYEVRKIKDLRDMVKQSAMLYQDETAFLIKKDKGQSYSKISYKEFDQDIDALGTGMLLHLAAGSRVAIISETRYEWYVTYLATTNGVGIVVPIDKELPTQEILSLIQRSKAECVIYSNTKSALIASIQKDLPLVKLYINMDGKNTDPSENSVSFWDIYNQGKQELEQNNSLFTGQIIDPQTLSILLFTSGTTDTSKAVMLSHNNIAANLEGMCSMLYIGPGDVFLSVLPIHHTYECTCGFLCPIYRGCTIAQCEGLRYITKNMQESKVTILLGVPLMLEMFHKGIFKKVNSDPKMKRKFRLGLKLTKTLKKFGLDRRRQIFKAIHENFGGNLRMVISGGAPIDPQILQDFQDMGIHCVQGYGLTECAPILALNRDVDFNNQAAGLPLPGVDVKIIDKDENGIGEIIGKGPNVMLGYYENPEATSLAIDAEGYYHTGDLGYMDKDDFVIITGRKKNVIIAKNGKNIFPEEIETLLARSPYIAESLVSGEENAQQDDLQVKAEIFPNMEAVEEFLGSTYSKEDLEKLIHDEVKTANQNLVSYKTIRKIEIRDSEFEKTTSKKIKRQYK